MELRRFKDCGAVFSESLSSISDVKKKYTIGGNPTLVNSPFGKAMNFNGTIDYIGIGVKSFEDDFAISSWFKFDSTQTTWNTIIGTSGDDRFMVKSGVVYLQMAGQPYLYINYDFENNKWYNVVFVRDSSNISRLYINGVLVDSKTLQGGLSVWTYIGKEDSNPFKGNLSNIIIFNRALTLAEVENIYKNKSFDYDKNTIGHWKTDSTSLVQDIGWQTSNDGTVNGNPTLQDNMTGGKCLLFDATGDYINLSTPTDLNLIPRTDAYSVGAWIKLTSTSTNPIISKNDGDVQYQLYVNNIGKLHGIVGGTSSYSSTSVTADEWHHVVMTVPAASTGMKLYLNGEELAFGTGTGAIGTTTCSAAVHIGRGNTSYMDGEMDNVMVFNKVLTEMEIKDLMARTKGGRL